jgi:hypothetical protein
MLATHACELGIWEKLYLCDMELSNMHWDVYKKAVDMSITAF